jgi:hypothetical protein
MGTNIHPNHHTTLQVPAEAPRETDMPQMKLLWSLQRVSCNGKDATQL